MDLSVNGTSYFTIGQSTWTEANEGYIIIVGSSEVFSGVDGSSRVIRGQVWSSSITVNAMILTPPNYAQPRAQGFCLGVLFAVLLLHLTRKK